MLTPAHLRMWFDLIRRKYLLLPTLKVMDVFCGQMCAISHSICDFLALECVPWPKCSALQHRSCTLTHCQRFQLPFRNVRFKSELTFYPQASQCECPFPLELVSVIVPAKVIVTLELPHHAKRHKGHKGADRFLMRFPPPLFLSLCAACLLHCTRLMLQ